MTTMSRVWISLVEINYGCALSRLRFADRRYSWNRPDLADLSFKKSSMEPLRFVHAADLHLDSPFRGVGEASANSAGSVTIGDTPRSVSRG